MEPHYVAHVYSEGRNEEQTRARPGLHQGSIEVQGPIFRLNLSGWQLGICPFSHEISQDLRLDRFSRRKGQGFPHKLDSPLGYPSRGLPVMDYLAQGEG